MKGNCVNLDKVAVALLICVFRGHGMQMGELEVVGDVIRPGSNLSEGLSRVEPGVRVVNDSRT